MRSTHTVALMDVSSQCYREIRKALEDADYSHAMIDRDGEFVLDMNGIGLKEDKSLNPLGKDTGDELATAAAKYLPVPLDELFDRIAPGNPRERMELLRLFKKLLASAVGQSFKED